jgi:hypothetical protein
MTITTVLQLIGMPLAIYFCFYGCYWLILVLAGREKTHQKFLINRDNPEVLLILPAYRPGPIFRQVLDSVARATRHRNIRTYVLLQRADAEYQICSSFYKPTYLCATESENDQSGICDVAG